MLFFISLAALAIRKPAYIAKPADAAAGPVGEDIKEAPPPGYRVATSEHTGKETPPEYQPEPTAPLKAELGHVVDELPAAVAVAGVGVEDKAAATAAEAIHTASYLKIANNKGSPDTAAGVVGLDQTVVVVEQPAATVSTETTAATSKLAAGSALADATEAGVPAAVIRPAATSPTSSPIASNPAGHFAPKRATTTQGAEGASGAADAREATAPVSPPSQPVDPLCNFPSVPKDDPVASPIAADSEGKAGQEDTRVATFA